MFKGELEVREPVVIEVADRYQGPSYDNLLGIVQQEQSGGFAMLNPIWP